MIEGLAAVFRVHRSLTCCEEGCPAGICFVFHERSPGHWVFTKVKQTADGYHAVRDLTRSQLSCLVQAPGVLQWEWSRPPRTEPYLDYLVRALSEPPELRDARPRLLA